MTLARAYLWLLALLYLAFAVLCTLRPAKTAGSLGLRFADVSGRVEYTVVYGGLELGIALFFALGALRPGAELPALWLAFLLHLCLAVFRVILIATNEGLSGTLYAIFALEAALALAGGFLAISRGLPE